VDRRSYERGLILACLAYVALIASCATYTAVVEAPAEFWITAEEIVVALILDVWTVIEWLL